MSTISIAYGRPTLADRIFSRSLVTDIILIAAGTALTSILAQIAIPFEPVPITGQTFAVLFVGATLGVTRAVLSMGLYLVLGLFLPIYSPQANGSHLPGVQVLLGATGGYIVGFILAAAFVGWLAQREWDRKWLRTLLAFLAGSILIYAIGVPWLYVSLSNLHVANPLQAALTGGLYPFLIGDALKAIFAAVLLPVVWHFAGPTKKTPVAE
ncbi:MAG TPA: biotin transporter BioY [Galbitalea sp.]|jgi:biotin transport system substrate-specific component|nr:biotin transporter BioY [Galbitalea sp.]